VRDCLAVDAGRTCAGLCLPQAILPFWVGRSGVVVARLQGAAVVRAPAEAYSTMGKVTHTPPPQQFV
jgi:hypothetical protein